MPEQLEEQAGTTEPYLSVDQVLDLLPGTTRGWWATLRYSGRGPRFYKPSPKVVLYKASDIREWVDASAKTQTADEVNSDA